MAEAVDDATHVYATVRPTKRSLLLVFRSELEGPVGGWQIGYGGFQSSALAGSSTTTAKQHDMTLADESIASSFS